MQFPVDTAVMALIIVISVVWIYVRFHRWLYGPIKLKIPEDAGNLAELEGTDTVALLQEAGYQVLAGKYRVPIHIRLDDDHELESRLFIDCFARSDNELYVVKIAKDRKPIEWTGSGIRERLLAYTLLFDNCSGVLYVDTKERKVNKIKFDIGGYS